MRLLWKQDTITAEDVRSVKDLDLPHLSLQHFCACDQFMMLHRRALQHTVACMTQILAWFGGTLTPFALKRTDVEVGDPLLAWIGSGLVLSCTTQVRCMDIILCTNSACCTQRRL